MGEEAKTKHLRDGPSKPPEGENKNAALLTELCAVTHLRRGERRKSHAPMRLLHLVLLAARVVLATDDARPTPSSPFHPCKLRWLAAAAAFSPGLAECRQQWLLQALNTNGVFHRCCGVAMGCGGGRGEVWIWFALDTRRGGGEASFCAREIKQRATLFGMLQDTK